LFLGGYVFRIKEISEVISRLLVKLSGRSVSLR
jgi:hypothetical protein